MMVLLAMLLTNRLLRNEIEGQQVCCSLSVLNYVAIPCVFVS